MKPGEISARDAAEMIGCCDDTVYKLIARGEIDAYRLSDPGWYRIIRKSVESYLRRIRSKGRRKR